jgi:hypothetical protein
MRTIGIKWKRKVIELTQKYKAQGMKNATDIQNLVNNELPEEVFDIWESGWAEINRIVWDEAFKS